MDLAERMADPMAVLAQVEMFISYLQAHDRVPDAGKIDRAIARRMMLFYLREEDRFGRRKWQPGRGWKENLLQAGYDTDSGTLQDHAKWAAAIRQAEKEEKGRKEERKLRKYEQMEASVTGAANGYPEITRHNTKPDLLSPFRKRVRMEEAREGDGEPTLRIG
jgi:hypothetical protein